MEYQTFQHVARNGITGLILCARVTLFLIGNTPIGHNQKRVRAKMFVIGIGVFTVVTLAISLFINVESNIDDR